MAKDDRRSTSSLLDLVHDSWRIGDWPAVELQAVHLVVVVYMSSYFLKGRPQRVEVSWSG
jgi:hypothetical protein